MEDPKSSGYQTKDNPLQEAYKALRRLEEHPEAATADVLKETRHIAETVRQGAIIEHERILQIDDRSDVLEALTISQEHIGQIILAWDEQREEFAEREAALHRTTRWAVSCTFLASVSYILFTVIL